MEVSLLTEVRIWERSDIVSNILREILCLRIAARSSVSAGGERADISIEKALKVIGCTEKLVSVPTPRER